MWVNRFVIALLGSPFGRGLRRSVLALRYTARDGHVVTVPVQYADGEGGTLVVYPARPDHKTWWRHFGAPAAVEVLREGRWQPATGRLVDDGTAYLAALAAYRRRWPRVLVPSGTPFVVVTPG